MDVRDGARKYFDRAQGECYVPRYALATATLGAAVCGPEWMDAEMQAKLLKPVAVEYELALERCREAGVVHDFLREVELICKAQVDGLECIIKFLCDKAKVRGALFDVLRRGPNWKWTRSNCSGKS